MAMGRCDNHTKPKPNLGRCGMLSAVCALPGAAACVAISAHKLELTLLQTFSRGIGGGILISLLTPLTFDTDPGPNLRTLT